MGACIHATFATSPISRLHAGYFITDESILVAGYSCFSPLTGPVPSMHHLVRAHNTNVQDAASLLRPGWGLGGSETTKGKGVVIGTELDARCVLCTIRNLHFPTNRIPEQPWQTYTKLGHLLVPHRFVVGPRTLLQF